LTSTVEAFSQFEFDVARGMARLVRTAHRLSEKCASRRDCAALVRHPANAVWQSRLSSCRASISRNSEIVGFFGLSLPGPSAEKFCSTPLNRQSATLRRNTGMEESPRMATCLLSANQLKLGQNRLAMPRHD
jgi:hypothetical protein